MFLDHGDHKVLEDEKGCGFVTVSHLVLPYTFKFLGVFKVRVSDSYASEQRENSLG